MRKIEFLPTVDPDFIRIYEHYAYERGVPHVADRIDAGIRESVKKHLPFNPGIGRLVRKQSEMRGFLTLKTHWVFYDYDDATIYVHRIMAAKEIESWDELDI